MKNLRNKLLNNIGLKLLAIVCAIILWLVVMNISDYSVTVEIDNIPVEQLNGDVLEELDQIYDVGSGDTVDIIVKGRRSIVSKLTRSDFNATADLATMSITNTVQIFVEPKDASIADDISITCVDNTMSLILEDKISLQFPIKVNVNGTPDDGYAVGEAYATPNIVTVEGPRSTIERITDVTTTVSANTKSESFETESNIVVRDAYGDEIVNDRMTVNYSTVAVNVAIYPVKSVPVNVEIMGKPEDGYGVGEVQYQPQTVNIAGTEESLSKIDAIYIDDISVSGLKENLQSSVSLNNYLPEGVFIAQSNDEIVVNVTIEKFEEKTFRPNIGDITIKNELSDEYTYEFVLSDGFSITVSGLTDDLAKVDMDALMLELDCGELSVGENINVSLGMKKEDNLEYKINGIVTVVVEEK